MRARLQPGDPIVLQGKRLITEAQMKGYEIVTIRFQPDWPIQWVKDQVKRVKAMGKKYTLLAMSGQSWTPWEPHNIEMFSALARTLGNLFNLDESCYGVHITGCTPRYSSTRSASEELHWKKEDWKKVARPIMSLIDIWSDAFPKPYKLLAIAGDYKKGMIDTIDYGHSLLGGKLIVKNNAMKKNTDYKAAHNWLVRYAVELGCSFGFENNGPMSAADLREVFQVVQEFELMLTKDCAYHAVYPN